MAPFLAWTPVCFLDVLGVAALAALWPPVYFLVLGVGTQCMEWQTRKRANEQKRINAKAEKVKGEKLDNGMANKEKGKRTKKDKRKS